MILNFFFFVIFSCFLDNQTGQYFSPSTTNFGSSLLQNVPSGFPLLGDFRSYLSPIRNPNNEVQGLTLLKLEREQLRGEIILSEIARQRELKMEVRREIMLLEREIGMRREVTRIESLLFSEDHHKLPMVGIERWESNSQQSYQWESISHRIESMGIEFPSI